MLKLEIMLEKKDRFRGFFFNLNSLEWDVNFLMLW